MRETRGFDPLVRWITKARAVGLALTKGDRAIPSAFAPDPDTKNPAS